METDFWVKYKRVTVTALPGKGANALRPCDLWGIVRSSIVFTEQGVIHLLDSSGIGWPQVKFQTSSTFWFQSA